MNTLTTRKIILGMLVALVLAFCVQGIAEALTFSTSKTGDLETKAPNEQFTIRFSVSLKGNTAIRNSVGDLVIEGRTTLIDSSGYQLNSDGNRINADEGDAPPTAGAIPINSSGFRLDSDGNRVTTHIDKDSDSVVDSGETFYTLVDDQGVEDTVDSSGYSVNADGDRESPLNKPTPAEQFKVSDAIRYHYTSEAIKVDVEGNARIVKVGSRIVNIPDTADLNMYERSHAMYNGASEHEKLSGSVSLVLEPTGTDGDVITVTVTDETPTNDAPANGKSDPITFTLYSVKYQSNIANSTTTLVGDGVDYAFDNDVRPLGTYFTFAQDAEAPVHYSIDGSGSLLIRQAYGDGSPTSVKTASKTLSTSSSAPVLIDMRRGTNKVTAWVSGGTPETVIFMYQGTTPSKYPSIEITSGNNQIGATSGRLEEPLVVKVTDGNNRPLAGLAVAFTSDPADGRFIPIPETRVYTTTTDVDLVDDTDNTTVATSSRPAPNATLWVQTDSSGVAQVYYQLSSTAGDHAVTATIQGQTSLTKTFAAVADDDARRASLQMVAMEKATGTGKEGIYYLSVIARSVGGHRIRDVIIEFEALSGSLRPRATKQPGLGETGEAGTLPTGTTVATSGNEIFVITGSDGEAEVEYNVGPTDSTKVVTAEVHDEQGDLEYDFILDRVTFDVQHATSSRSDTSDDTGTDTSTPTLSVSTTSLTGRPGSTSNIIVTASALAQIGNIVFGEFLNAGGRVSPTSGSGTFTSTLTLPSTDGVYNLVISMGSQRRTVTVTVSSTAALGAQTGGILTIETDVSGRPGDLKTVTVRTTNADGTLAEGVVVRLRVTAGGGSFSPASVTTEANGTATSTFTRGSTVGSNHFISATTTPTGYNTSDSRGVRITISGSEPPPAGDTSTPRAVGEPDSIDVYDGDGQRGVPNVRLAEPLVVEVVDANDDPVSNVRVRFRTTIGSGRFSPVLTRTARNGRAQTNFTPTSPGRIRITAFVNDVASRAVFNVTAGAAPASVTKVSGDNQSGSPGSALANPFVVEVKDEDGDAIEGLRVTFSVTAGGGSLSETSAAADEDGRAETTLTLGSERGVNSVQASVSGVDPVTFNTNIEPKILVAVANRPVMYWIDSGMLYGLTGAKAAKIAESANDVAVGGGKVYWTEQTGESGGTVNSANLDGTDVTELASIFATPIGIAVDAAGSKLYWTNASGRIQSANLDGSGIKNVMQNLSDPTDIVVSNGFIYWTEGGNSVRRVNISGQKIAIDVAVNLDSVGGLAVGGGKVYWTEMTSASAGTVNGANLNGTNFETLATLLSAPMGISVDTAGSKLYWTNARGRVQSANLNGSMIKNVVEGLISPSKLTIGGANTAVATTAKKATTSAKKDNAAYDVNSDGTVDNTDASLVAAAMNTSNAKYDVNGDGTVNFLDLLLVFDNREDAAAAPTIVGMKLTAIQIDIIQEQIDLLIATNDRSPAALRTLIYMQQLLATARPEKTQLLANYPNPFNPETWIPYELATDTNVRITIYNTQGVVIRTLQFGHQSAGYYTGRDRAAYWDGRNALGEQVASGLYFYQLETDEMSLMRKMVILK